MGKYSHLFTLFLPLLFTLNSEAQSLKIQNASNVAVIVDELFNICDGLLISDSAPLTLQPGEYYYLPKITNIMHHYRICALGFCESSSIPVRDEIEYELKVTLIKDYLISGEPVPDHWVGNTECPAANSLN